jgi:hypothetical protein
MFGESPLSIFHPRRREDAVTSEKSRLYIREQSEGKLNYRGLQVNRLVVDGGYDQTFHPPGGLTKLSAWLVGTRIFWWVRRPGGN